MNFVKDPKAHRTYDLEKDLSQVCDLIDSIRYNLPCYNEKVNWADLTDDDIHPHEAEVNLLTPDGIKKWKDVDEIKYESYFFCAGGRCVIPGFNIPIVYAFVIIEDNKTTMNVKVSKQCNMDFFFHQLETYAKLGEISVHEILKNGKYNMPGSLIAHCGCNAPHYKRFPHDDIVDHVPLLAVVDTRKKPNYVANGFTPIDFKISTGPTFMQFMFGKYEDPYTALKIWKALINFKTDGNMEDLFIDGDISTISRAFEDERNGMDTIRPSMFFKYLSKM
jgi:hypothetical protein